MNKDIQHGVWQRFVRHMLPLSFSVRFSCRISTSAIEICKTNIWQVSVLNIQIAIVAALQPHTVS